MSKIKKTALIGVVGASALTAGYYTFVKPSIQTTPSNQKTQNINQAENKESKKEYYTEYAKGYLIRDEEFEQIPTYLEDAEQTYKKRQEEIDNLRQEYKIIKKLKV